MVYMEQAELPIDVVPFLRAQSEALGIREGALSKGLDGALATYACLLHLKMPGICCLADREDPVGAGVASLAGPDPRRYVSVIVNSHYCDCELRPRVDEAVLDAAIGAAAMADFAFLIIAKGGVTVWTASRDVATRLHEERVRATEPACKIERVVPKESLLTLPEALKGFYASTDYNYLVNYHRHGEWLPPIFERAPTADDMMDERCQIYPFRRYYYETEAEVAPEERERRYWFDQGAVYDYDGDADEVNVHFTGLASAPSWAIGRIGMRLAGNWDRLGLHTGISELEEVGPRLPLTPENIGTDWFAVHCLGCAQPQAHCECSG